MRPVLSLTDLVSPGLDQAADAFSSTLSVKLKDDAVKQDRERTNELQRSALRALAALHRLASPGEPRLAMPLLPGADYLAATSPKFSQLLRDAAQHPSWANEFKEMLAREQKGSSLGSSYNGATYMDVDV